MEVSTRNGLNGKPTPVTSNATPGTPNKHVNFGGSTGEEKKREKFLTAKYGAHQMALIRKRLRVEMWMYERLQEIYGAVSAYKGKLFQKGCFRKTEYPLFCQFLWEFLRKFLLLYELCLKSFNFHKENILKKSSGKCNKRFTL